MGKIGLAPAASDYPATSAQAFAGRTGARVAPVRAVRAQATAQKISRKPVATELEKFNNTDNLPMNTFNNKAPFKAKIK